MRHFSSAAQEQSRGLTVVSCPLRARLGAFGFGSPADLVSDHLVSQRRAVLVDERGACGAVAHPVHEFAETAPSVTGQRVTGMSQVVNMDAGQPGRFQRLAPLTGEVASP